MLFVHFVYCVLFLGLRLEPRTLTLAKGVPPPEMCLYLYTCGESEQQEQRKCQQDELFLLPAKMHTVMMTVEIWEGSFCLLIFIHLNL